MRLLIYCPYQLFLTFPLKLKNLLENRNSIKLEVYSTSNLKPILGFKNCSWTYLTGFSSLRQLLNYLTMDKMLQFLTTKGYL